LKARQAEEKLKDAEALAKKAEKEVRKVEKDLQKAESKLQTAETELQTARDRRRPRPAACRRPGEARRGKIRAQEDRRRPRSRKRPNRKSPVEEAVVEPRAGTRRPSGRQSTVTAKPLFRRACHRRRLHPPAVAGGRNDVALATVQEARKTAPRDMNLALIEGIALIRLQQLPEAASLLVDLAKNNPRNAEDPRHPRRRHDGRRLLRRGPRNPPHGHQARQEPRRRMLLQPRPALRLGRARQDLKLARKYYDQALDPASPPMQQLDKMLK
jgi:hypothetical protein